MTADEASLHLALAADLPLPQAQALYREVCGQVGWVKVGLSLFVEHGPQAVRAFTSQGARVFLDLKLHDIPNTVRLAAQRAGELGVGLLTVHAQGGQAMLRAAVEGAAEGAARVGAPPPRILAVTVLTSLDDAALGWLGQPLTASQYASHLAGQALQAGVEGLVCSPREVRALRAAHGATPFLCTPGIRPLGSAAGDQARAETPTFAVHEGSDLLVVGRPIYAASDPAAAARALHQEVMAA
jgi:orotidine-5'-phosphate decarboxylase